MILDIYSYVKEVFVCLVMDTSLLLTWFCLMSCASATQIYMCSSVGTQELTGFCNPLQFLDGTVSLEFEYYYKCDFEKCG